MKKLMMMLVILSMFSFAGCSDSIDEQPTIEIENSTIRLDQKSDTDEEEEEGTSDPIVGGGQ